MEKMLKYLLLFVFLVTLNACDKALCGELNKEQKKQLNIAKNRYPQFEISNIPCENYYINLRIKVDEIDTASLSSAHKLLYNPKTKIGWKAIMVFNKNNKYLFTHNYNKNIYIQKGD